MFRTSPIGPRLKTGERERAVRSVSDEVPAAYFENILDFRQRQHQLSDFIDQTGGLGERCVLGQLRGYKEITVIFVGQETGGRGAAEQARCNEAENEKGHDDEPSPHEHGQEPPIRVPRCIDRNVDRAKDRVLLLLVPQEQTREHGRQRQRDE